MNSLVVGVSTYAEPDSRCSAADVVDAEALLEVRAFEKHLEAGGLTEAVRAGPAAAVIGVEAPKYPGAGVAFGKTLVPRWWRC